MFRLSQYLPSLLLIPLLCACSPSGVAAPKQTTGSAAITSSPLQESKTMSETQASLPPVRDGGEVLQRLLTLIDSLHQPQDLTPENVTRFTGVVLQRDGSRLKYAGYEGNATITEKWFYWYMYHVDDDTDQPGFSFSFHETEQYKDSNPPMTAICQLDMDQFHTDLLKMGFQHYSSNRQDLLGRQYQRDRLLLDVYYAGESEDKVDHKCVYKVYANFLETYINFGELK